MPTTTYPHPDMFTRVSYDFLKRLDAEPGAWLGQAKRNGECIVLHVDGDTVMIKAKDGRAKGKMPEKEDDIIQYLSICGLDGVSLQAEMIGPRKDYNGDMPAHRIEVVDCLRWSGQWLRQMPFAKRLGVLKDNGITHLPVVESPHLCELFSAQLTDPVSEGIVVRSASSGLVLHPDVCKVRRDWFKVKFRG